MCSLEAGELLYFGLQFRFLQAKLKYITAGKGVPLTRGLIKGFEGACVR